MKTCGPLNNLNCLLLQLAEKHDQIKREALRNEAEKLEAIRAQAAREEAARLQVTCYYRVLVGFLK